AYVVRLLPPRPRSVPKAGGRLLQGAELPEPAGGHAERPGHAATCPGRARGGASAPGAGRRTSAGRLETGPAPPNLPAFPQEPLCQPGRRAGATGAARPSQANLPPPGTADPRTL